VYAYLHKNGMLQILLVLTDVMKMLVKNGMKSMKYVFVRKIQKNGMQQLVRIFATQLTVNNGMLP
jgi:hypothetical protein